MGSLAIHLLCHLSNRSICEALGFGHVKDDFTRKLCSSESSPFLHELGNVGVDDAVPLLDGIASR